MLDQYDMNHIFLPSHLSNFRWRDAGFQNEARFADSMNLIREIFENQMKDGWSDDAWFYNWDLKNEILVHGECMWTPDKNCQSNDI